MRAAIMFLAAVLCLPVFALPPAAADLKAKRDAKVGEIDRVYAAELDKLQKKAMDSGNLTAANEIQQEIEAVTKNPFESDNPVQPKAAPEDARLKPLIGVWKRDTDNGVWKITDTQNGILNGNEPFTLKYDTKSNRVIVVSEKWVNYFTFTANPNVVIGQHEVSGKQMRFKLNRAQ